MESNNNTSVPAHPGNHITQTWLAASASVPGRSHLRTGIPCQDAAAAGVSPRPYLIVCDGRGSASHADIGANAAIEAIVAQLDNASEVFAQVLDADNEEESARGHPLLVRLIYRTAAQEQRRQANSLGASPESFEHTLLVIVCGCKRFLYIQVGDGGIVMQRTDGSLQVLSEPARGEFANTTFFVTCGRQTSWRHRLMPMDGVAGFMAFSDGTAEKLITAADNTASAAVGQILGQAATGRFGREEVLRFLTETHWEPQVQDDRSLAILMVGSSTASNSEPDVVPAPSIVVPALNREVHSKPLVAIPKPQRTLDYWFQYQETIIAVLVVVAVQLAILVIAVMLLSR